MSEVGDVHEDGAGGMRSADADAAAETRLLDTFLDLVRIDSPSREEASCAAYCERELLAAGCSVRYDHADVMLGSDTGNLIAELPGTVPGVLVLSAHLDVVEPCRGIEPVVHDGTVVAAGETVLGADDRAGLAAAIEAVRRLSTADVPRPAIRCVFTIQEEIGLRGAKELSADAVEGDLCLVLDADGEVGGIVTGAPTHYTFNAVFTGVASHAGVAPERGVSAIAMAADAVSRLPIGRIDDATTANVGTLAGGTATNVIAARVEVTGECRSRVRERVEELREQMDRTMREAAERAGGRVEIEWRLEYEGFHLADDARAVQVVKRACERLGLASRAFETGGGSDANIIAALGVPTVALSCGMKGVHSTSEQIDVVDLERLAALCVETAKVMAGGTEGRLGDSA